MKGLEAGSGQGGGMRNVEWQASEADSRSNDVRRDSIEHHSFRWKLF